MRSSVCALLLLLTLCPGEALRCNYCFSSGTELCMATQIQTCSRLDNACGDVILGAPLNRSFRQCMSMEVCQGYISTPGAFASCCSNDLCN